MRIPGYCTGCRRIKNSVSVSGHQLALGHARGGVYQGICADCEEEERQRTINRKGQRT